MAARKISQDDYAKALARGRQALAEPYAVSARYVASARVLELAYSVTGTGKLIPCGLDLVRELLLLRRTDHSFARVMAGPPGFTFPFLRCGRDQIVQGSLTDLAGQRLISPSR
jgi:hypothetical protein